MKTARAWLTVIGTLYLSAAPATADVCRWTDARGVIHFSQRCDPNQKAEQRWQGGTGSARERAPQANPGGAAFSLSVTTTPVLQERTVASTHANPPPVRSTP